MQLLLTLKPAFPLLLYPNIVPINCKVCILQNTLATQYGNSSVIAWILPITFLIRPSLDCLGTVSSRRITENNCSNKYTIAEPPYLSISPTTPSVFLFFYFLMHITISPFSIIFTQLLHAVISTHVTLNLFLPLGIKISIQVKLTQLLIVPL